MICGRYLTHRISVETGACLDCGHDPSQAERLVPNEPMRVVDAIRAMCAAAIADTHPKDGDVKQAPGGAPQSGGSDSDRNAQKDKS